MAGLMDMFSGADSEGQYPGLAGTRNSLIGLGLGLMSRPGWGGALGGFEAGARTDATNMHASQQARQHAATLAQHRADQARQADQFNRSFDLQKQQFERGEQPKPQIHFATEENDDGEKTSVPYLFLPGKGGDYSFKRLSPEAAGNLGPALGGQPQGAPPPMAPPPMTKVPYLNGPGPTTPQFAEPQPQPTNIWGDPVQPQQGGQPQQSGPPSPYVAPEGMQGAQKKAYKKIVAEKTAGAIVNNQEDAIKSAKAAAELKPALDEMTTSYEDLIKKGGIGPIVGAGPDYGPRKAAAIFHTENEDLRQRYDTAVAKVKALVTAAQNKGEGTVSNYERMMYAQQFPQLTASNPASQLPFLKQLQQTTAAAIEAGRGSALGAAPGGDNMMYPRPPIVQDQATSPVGVAPQGKSYPTPSKGAINRLRAMGDREIFDQYYGPGAADKALGAR
jgi:hypothetical protein